MTLSPQDMNTLADIIILFAVIGMISTVVWIVIVIKKVSKR